MPADARQFLFANNATCSLGADISPSDTALVLEIGKGALFPAPIFGQLFKLTLQNMVTGAFEIMNATSRSSDTVTVERAVEGTTALAWPANTTVVQNRVTAESLAKLQEAGAGGGGGGGGGSLIAPYLTYAISSELIAAKVLATEVGVLSMADEGAVMRVSLVDNGITNTKFRQSVGLSVVGRGSNSTGNVADLVAGADGDVLRRIGGTIGFGTITQAAVIGLVSALAQLSADIAAGDAAVLAVANAKVDTTRTIATTNSLTGGGDLSSNRTLQLVNDTAAPGNAMFYGTDGTGTRGWYAQVTGVTAHSGLTGLTADDHTQYHNDARGDARYPPLARTITVANSLTGGGSLAANRTIALSGDTAAPGNNMFYGTNGTGVRGWYAVSTGVTVHSGLTGLAADDHTQYHNDTRGDLRYPPLARSIATANSLTGGGDLSSNRTLALVGDTAAPGNNMVYGTNGTGVRGWYAAASGGVTAHGSLTGLANDDHTQYLNNARGDARYPPLARSIATTLSLTGGGDLSANRTLQLVGDSATPGNLSLWGTDSVGARGWWYTIDENATASTIVRRATGGYIYATYLNQNSGANENPAVSQVMVTSAADTFLRKASLAHLMNSANLGTASNAQFNSIGIGTAAAGTAGDIRATGNVTAFFSSDIRLKTNVVEIKDALAKCLKMRGVTHGWTDEYIASRGGLDGVFVREDNLGVIAQEVQAVFPQIVMTRYDGTLAVDYEKMVPVLLQAVKELAARVAA
jgi:hypothetical protein